jgi:hypothetical protein
MRPEARATLPSSAGLRRRPQSHFHDHSGAAQTSEFERSLFLETAADTVGGDGLDDLLEVLAEIGLEAAAERDRRKGELRVAAS